MDKASPARFEFRDWRLIAASGAVLVALAVYAIAVNRPQPAIVILLAALALAVAWAAWYPEYKARLAADQRTAGLPRLKVPEQGFFGVRRQVDLVVGGVLVPNKKIPLSSIAISFENDPVSPAPESVGQQVTAQVSFQDASGKPLFEKTALWNEQVTQLIEFPIGVKRSLDIAFKYLSEADCYGACHESAKDRFAKREPFKLPPGEYNVNVRLRGVNIDSAWRLRFKNPEGNQPLDPISCAPVPAA